MILKHFFDGLRHVQRRPGLAVLVYVVDLVVAFVLTVPVYAVLQAEVGAGGFGAEMAREFDAILWSDVIETYGPAFGAMARQLLWVVPLVVSWKVVLGIGLVYALGRGASRPFWEGARRFMVRGVLMALLFGVTLVIGLLVLVPVAVVLYMLVGDPVTSFWVTLLVMPALVVAVFTATDLMHDYGRTALVLKRRGVAAAWREGMTWPWRHRAATGLYALWFVLAALLWLVPVGLDATLPGATTAGVWSLFVLQQLALAARAVATVGWFGSEVALYEAVREAEVPLLAAADGA